MNEMTVARIYANGWRPEDFEELLPGSAILSPIRPPEKIGALVTTDQSRAILGQTCRLFRVEKVCLPDDASQAHSISGRTVKNTAEPAYIRVQPGDVVMVRNALLDPLDPEGNLLEIHVKHIVAKVAG